MVQANVLRVYLFLVLVLQRPWASFRLQMLNRNLRCIMSTLKLLPTLSLQRNCLSSPGHDARPDQPHLWVLLGHTVTPPIVRRPYCLMIRIYAL
jgi:hypothetical protein